MAEQIGLGSEKEQCREREVVSQRHLFLGDREKLFDELCSVEVLRRGFRMVKKNHGAPGIDGVTVETFEKHLSKELYQLSHELASWTYQSQPVRRVEIPKPGKRGEVRLLGIPCLRDRVVQAALKVLIEPIWEPLFSASSYGFRPRRNQGQAVQAAKKLIATGKEHVVDIDLSKFFDRVHHDRLIFRLGQEIPDKRILRLIGTILRSGVMQDGLFSPTQIGTVQGSPLSPLLSNIVLDELDKELERRGLAFCRFADDCNIYVGSHKAALRVMDSIRKYIENRLKLVVNLDKSKVALAHQIKFLGMTIIAGTIAISSLSVQAAMTKIKELIPRRSYQTLEVTIQEINQWYKGWSNYYDMTEYPYQLVALEGHIRRRLRARIVTQQKNLRNLFNKLVQRHVPRRRAASVFYRNQRWWVLSHTRAVEQAYPNQWFKDDMGLFIRSDQKQPHWFPLTKRIKIS